MTMNHKLLHHQTSGLKLKIVTCLVFMLLLFSLIPSFSQSELYLQHKLKPNRQRKISFKKEYEIQTSDTIFYHHQISYFSDDTLLISSKCCPQSLKLPFSDITSIEKSKKYGVFEVIGTIGIIALSVTPVIWATEGNEAALGMLEVSGVFLAASAPFLAIKEIGRKKDTKTKWMIKVG
jgi:hypothetical protein